MISSFQSHPTDQPNWPSTQDETSIASWKTWALQKIHLNQSFLTFFSQTDSKNRVKCVLVFSRTHMHTSTNLRNVCMRFCWGQSDIHWYFQQCNIVSPWFSRSFSSPSPFLKRRTRGDHQQLDRKFGCNLAFGVDLLDRCRSFGLCLSHVPWH